MIENRNIYITGRIKNMVVLSGGKKVFPEEVEAVLEKSPYFAEVCVLGVKRSFGAKDGTEEVAAVVVPKDDVIAKNDEESLEMPINTTITTSIKNSISTITTTSNSTEIPNSIKNTSSTLIKMKKKI